MKRFRVKPGGKIDLSDFDPASTPGFNHKDAERARPESTSGSTPCRTSSTPRAAARCWWSSRASTPPARTAPSAACSTASARSASPSPPSRRRARRSSPRLPLARHHMVPGRGTIGDLQPLPLRGRAGRAGARARARQEVGAALRPDQRLREAAHREGTTFEILAPHLQGRAEGAPPGAPRRPQKTGSSAGDLDDRALWADSRRLRGGALAPPDAPWYVVPADKKWDRNLAVATVLVKALEDLSIQIPKPRKISRGSSSSRRMNSYPKVMPSGATPAVIRRGTSLACRPAIAICPMARSNAALRLMPYPKAL